MYAQGQSLLMKLQTCRTARKMFQSKLKMFSLNNYQLKIKNKERGCAIITNTLF